MSRPNPLCFSPWANEAPQKSPRANFMSRSGQKVARGEKIRPEKLVVCRFSGHWGRQVGNDEIGFFPFRRNLRSTWRGRRNQGKR
jgi:hypothetical protein